MKNIITAVSGVLVLAVSLSMCASTLETTHYPECPSINAFNASIIITLEPGSVEPNTILAAFGNDGICYGQILVTGGNQAFAVKGDDPITPEIDGLITGEEIRLRAYGDAALGYATTEGGLMLYAADGVYVITATMYEGSTNQAAFDALVFEADSLRTDNARLNTLYETSDALLATRTAELATANAAVISHIAARDAAIAERDALQTKIDSAATDLSRVVTDLTQ